MASCAWEGLGPAGFPFPGRPTRVRFATLLLGRSVWRTPHPEWSFTLKKPTPNPPEIDNTSPYESPDSKKFHEAAERALDYHLGPNPDAKAKPKPRKGALFTASSDLNTETLLANASEDLLAISAIAADLADDVEGTRRSVALALSRLADGVQLMVERALDQIDSPDPRGHWTKA